MKCRNQCKFWLACSETKCSKNVLNIASIIKVKVIFTVVWGVVICLLILPAVLPNWLSVLKSKWGLGFQGMHAPGLYTFHFHALEKEMATHSSVLAWRILGTGEPGGLPSMGSHRVRHDWSDLAAADNVCIVSVNTFWSYNILPIKIILTCFKKNQPSSHESTTFSIVQLFYGFVIYYGFQLSTLWSSLMYRSANFLFPFLDVQGFWFISIEHMDTAL